MYVQCMFMSISISITIFTVVAASTDPLRRVGTFREPLPNKVTLQLIAFGVYTYIYIYICTHTYIHTHIYTHIEMHV